MKIVDIQTFLAGSDVFVKIATDEGLVGYGEGTNFMPRAVVGMIEDLKPYVLGEDPRRIEHLWQSCFRRLFLRGGPVTGSALAAIDIALWDLKGKALGVPVYELLGGLARDKVRVYGPVAGKTAEEMARKAKKLADRGVTAIRYRAFHDWDELNLHDHKRAVMQQTEYTEAIRAAVGDDVDLIIECHGRYDPEYAVMLARNVERFRPLYIEDPIRHENPQAYKRLRPFTSVPLATGERGHNKWDYRELLEHGLVDYLRPDICWCGGITEMRKIAAMAETYYVNLVPHNNWGPLGTAASLHVSLALSNVALLELPASASDPADLKVDAARPYPRIENGYALPLQGPGLGIQFDEQAALARPRKQPGITPKLNALDGSVRDW